MSGYTELGGSLFSQGLSGFLANSMSANEDITPSRRILVSRARVLDMSVPIARAAVDRIVSGVVGGGLYWDDPVSSEFYADELDAYKRIVKTIQKKLKIWSLSHLCDCQGILTFAQLQRIVCRNWLLSGDVFLIRVKRGNLSGWRVIEGDRCATPLDFSPKDMITPKFVNPANGRTVIDGVELDDFGAPCAYYFFKNYDYITNDYERIPAYDDTGLPLVVHVYNAERPDQYRGIPLLSSVIETIYGTACYAQSELQSAILESCYSLFIESNAPPSVDPFAPVDVEELKKPLIPDENFKLSPDNAGPLGVPGLIKKGNLIGPGETRRLLPGESIKTVDPKRPNSGFDNFMKTQNGMIAAAIGVPLQVLQSTYDGTTYASARAATVEAWRTFKIYRSVFIEMFIKKIIEVFAYECTCDMFGEPDAELSKIISLESEWTGPSAVCLDPTKELDAYNKALEMGLVSADEVAQGIYGHSARIEKKAENNNDLVDGENNTNVK